MPKRHQPMTDERRESIKQWRAAHMAKCADCGKPCTYKCERCFQCSRRVVVELRAARKAAAKVASEPAEPFLPRGKWEDLRGDVDPAKDRAVREILERIKRNDIRRVHCVEGSLRRP